MKILIRKVFLFFAVLIILSTEITFSYSSDEKQILAILPFKNLSGYKNIDWMSEGIAASLITKLSKAEDLIIVERYHIKKILEEIRLKMTGITEGTAVDTGKLLGATTMVLGEFQYFDQNIKISLRLIDVNTGKIEESDEISGKLKDIFFLEEKLSQRILTLLGKSMDEIGQFEIALINTTSIKAYEEYSMAKNVWDGKSIEPENIKTAIKHYRKALKYDPKYFLAAMELGDAMMEIAEFNKAIKWYKHALKIGKKEIENKNAINYCKNKAYEKASLAYLKKGKVNKALESLRKAFEAHPECFHAYSFLGHIYRQKGEMEKAISAYRKAIEIKPYDPSGYYNLGVALKEKGEKLEAIIAFRKAVERDFFEEIRETAQKYIKELAE